MADKTIGELTAATKFYDDSLLVAEQGGLAQSVSGKLIKEYFGEPYSTAAQEALDGVREAIDNIPDGVSTPIVNNLTTGGTSMALSAEMGKVLGQRPNPNILDNWYFPDPINQRGSTSYGGKADLYTIDRWKTLNENTTVTLGGDGITVAGAANSHGKICQAIENPNNLLGKTVTLSVITKAGSAYSLSKDTFTLDSELPAPGQERIYSGSSTFFVFTINTTSQGVSVCLLSGKDSSRTLVAAKLELGETQTLAHQDASGNWVLNALPNKAEELAKCQRFQVVYSLINTGLYGVCVAQLTTNAKLYIYTPVALRVLPTLTFDTSLLTIFDGTTNHTITTAKAYTSSQNIAVLNLTTSGLTVGNAYQLRSGGVSKLILDANL